MSRIIKAALALCMVFASPVLSYWEWDGISTHLEQPGSDSDPNGTWSWSADADGTVTFGLTGMTASGWAGGEVGISLTTEAGLGLSRYAYAYSGVSGSSSYRWVPDNTSKAVSFYVSVSVYPSVIKYSGNAVNRSGTVPAACSSGASVHENAGVSSVNYLDPDSSGLGSSNSEGGAYANNDSYFTPSVDFADANNSAISGWHRGELRFSGPTSNWYSGTPSGSYMSVSATVSGSAGAIGQLTIEDPDFYQGGFDAAASYYISANAGIAVYGNLDDRE